MMRIHFIRQIYSFILFAHLLEFHISWETQHQDKNIYETVHPKNNLFESEVNNSNNVSTLHFSDVGAINKHFEKHKKSKSSKKLVLNSVNFHSRKKRFFNIASKSLFKIKGFLSEWALTKAEAKQMFNEYYECQAAKVESLLREEFPIRAVLAVESDKVRLSCQICHRPDVASQRARWQFLRHDDTGLTRVTSSRHVNIARDNSLIIKSVDVKDAGQYFCLEHNDYAAVWQLDVFLTEKRKYVKLGKDPNLPETFLWKQNLRLFTKWGSWSECNTCGQLGQRSRSGHCTVSKIYQDVPVFPRDFPLMQLYPGGVPCHSTALPSHLRQAAPIKNRSSETLVSPCRVPCPTEPPARVVTDHRGKVLEVIKAGFYSIHEKPELPKLIKRRVIYEPEKSHLILKCPGDLSKEQIRWQRGDRDVDPLTVRRHTLGRVWMDDQRRLHLSPLLLSDTAVYKCWEKNRRVATIKLLVVDEAVQEVKLYISYIGLVVTVLGAVTLFVCLCCKKPNKHAH